MKNIHVYMIGFGVAVMLTQSFIIESQMEEVETARTILASENLLANSLLTETDSLNKELELLKTK